MPVSNSQWDFGSGSLAISVTRACRSGQFAMKHILRRAAWTAAGRQRPTYRRVTHWCVELEMSALAAANPRGEGKRCIALPAGWAVISSTVPKGLGQFVIRTPVPVRTHADRRCFRRRLFETAVRTHPPPMPRAVVPCDGGVADPANAGLPRRPSKARPRSEPTRSQVPTEGCAASGRDWGVIPRCPVGDRRGRATGWVWGY